MPCIPVTFEKEQIVVWRGEDYKPVEDGYFIPDRESFDDPDGNLICSGSSAARCGQQDFYSGDDDE